MATLKELYTALRADGAPLPDTYDRFESFMTEPGDRGYENRRQVYEALRADGAPLPGSYEEFRDALFTAGKRSGGAEAEQTSTATSAPVRPISDNTAQQAAAQSTMASQPAQPQGWQPSPMQQRAFQMQMDEANARLKKQGEEFQQRMEGIQKGNKPGTFIGEREFNPQTGKMETAYYTTQGDRVPTQMQQSRANTEYHQWLENNTEAGQRSKEQRLQREFDDKLSYQWQRHDPAEGKSAVEQAWSAAE